MITGTCMSILSMNMSMIAICLWLMIRRSLMLSCPLVTLLSGYNYRIMMSGKVSLSYERCWRELQ